MASAQTISAFTEQYRHHTFLKRNKRKVNGSGVVEEVPSVHASAVEVDEPSALIINITSITHVELPSKEEIWNALYAPGKKEESTETKCCLTLYYNDTLLYQACKAATITSRIDDEGRSKTKVHLSEPFNIDKLQFMVNRKVNGVISCGWASEYSIRIAFIPYGIQVWPPRSLVHCIQSLDENSTRLRDQDLLNPTQLFGTGTLSHLTCASSKIMLMRSCNNGIERQLTCVINNEISWNRVRRHSIRELVVKLPINRSLGKASKEQPLVSLPPAHKQVDALGAELPTEDDGLADNISERTSDSIHMEVDLPAAEFPVISSDEDMSDHASESSIKRTPTPTIKKPSLSHMPLLPPVIVPATTKPLYHAITRRLLSSGEVLPTTHKRADTSWRQQEHKDMINEMTFTEEEKDFIQRWDDFMAQQYVTADVYLARALYEFVKLNTASERQSGGATTPSWFARKKSRRLQFGLHCESLMMRQQITPEVVYHCTLLIRKACDTFPYAHNNKEEDAIKAIERGPTACICGVPVQPCSAIICSDPRCRRRYHHIQCIEKVTGVKPAKKGWRCDACKSLI